MTIQQSGSEIDIRLSPRLKLKDIQEFIDYLTYKEAIDIDDAPFIALAEYLNASLPSGDKVLSNGLKTWHYKKIVSTKDLQCQLFQRRPLL